MSASQQEDSDPEDLSCEGSLIVNMTSPMQDMVISSTVSSIYSPSSIHEHSLQGDISQRLFANDLWKSRNCSETSQCVIYHTQDCCFWISDFDNGLSYLAGSTNYKLFEHLLTVYAENIAKDAFKWKANISKMTTIRKHISNVLMYYHWYCNFHKKKIKDCYFYLQKVTEILAIYINLELEISKKFKNESISADKISNSLISKIWIYLENSEEHIFKAILKSKVSKKGNEKIFLPLLKKYCGSISILKAEITDISYVRYIIAIKLWKSISNDYKKIETLALNTLGPKIPSFNSEGLNFFPLPPKKCTNETMWLLNTNSFDLKNLITNFLAFEIDSHGSSCNDHLIISKKNEKCCHMQVNVMPNIIKYKKTKKRSKLQKQYYLEKKKSLETGEIILVDLTKEDKIQTCFKRKKSVRWLNNVKKFKDCTKFGHSINFENDLAYRNQFDMPSNDSNVDSTKKSEPSSLEIFNSNIRNCDNNLYNDLSIFSKSNEVIDNSINAKDQKSVNSELSKDSSIFCDLFDDSICDISIDINLLHKESENFSFSNLLSDSTKDDISFLLDSNLNDIDSPLNQIEVRDSSISRKNLKLNMSPTEIDISFNNVRKDSLLMNCKDRKHQLLIDVSDFGLSEVKEKISPFLDDGSLTTCLDVSSNQFLFKKNSEIELDEFSKTSFFDENLISDSNAIPLSEIHNMKKISYEKNEEILAIKEDYNTHEPQSATEKNSQLETKKLKSVKKNEDSSLKINNLIQPEDGTYLEKNSTREVSNFCNEFAPRLKIQNPSWSNQKFYESTKIYNFQKLTNFIINSGMNKIITVFDSGSSVRENFNGKKEKPFKSHYFIRLLFEKGRLLRHYTQNQGRMEKFVGIMSEKLRTSPDLNLESFFHGIDSDFSQANFVILFTNCLSSISKWFKKNFPLTFVIQEKMSLENKNMCSINDWDLTLSQWNCLQNEYQSKLKIIQVETHDIGCQLLAEKLEWSEELKKYEEST